MELSKPLQASQQVLTCSFCKRKGEVLYKNVQDRLYNTQGTWDFLHCESCNFIWLNPYPGPKDIKRFYNSYFLHNITESYSGRDTLFLLRNIIKKALLATELGYDDILVGEEKSLLKLIGRIISILIPQIKETIVSHTMFLYKKDRGKILDFGCGNGQFLAFLRILGWDVYGVEPDEKSAKIAKEHFNLPVYETIESGGFPDNFFDAIIMNHVIEHLIDPIALLTECKRVLQRDGKFVIKTPNIEGLGHKIFKDSWWGLDPPRHLNLFSLNSIKLCTRIVGFRIKMLRTICPLAVTNYRESKIIKKFQSRHFRNKTSKKMQFESILFWFFEELVRIFWRTAGEEIVLIMTK